MGPVRVTATAAVPVEQPGRGFAAPPTHQGTRRADRRRCETMDGRLDRPPACPGRSRGVGSAGDVGRPPGCKEGHVAGKRSKGVDPTWPELPEGEHPVTELSTDLQGALSPFGEVQFPLPSVPYVHPTTVINR